MKNIKSFFDSLRIKKILWFIVFFVCSLLIAECYPNTVSALALKVSKNSIYWLLIRWSIIFFFFLLWPRLINWIGQRNQLSKEKIAYWQATRYYIVFWVILFELIVCENIFIKLFQLN